MAGGFAFANTSHRLSSNMDNRKDLFAVEATDDSSDVADLDETEGLAVTTTGNDSEWELGILPPAIRSACMEVKLTDEQKAKIRPEFFANRKAVITAVSNLRLARLDFLQAVLDPASPHPDIAKMTEYVSKNVSDAAASRTSFKGKLFFNILTPEQRTPALKCLILLKRHIRQALAKRWASSDLE